MEKAVYDTKVAPIMSFLQKTDMLELQKLITMNVSLTTLVIEELAVRSQYKKKDVNVAEEIIEHIKDCFVPNLVILQRLSKKMLVLYCWNPARDIGILVSINTYKTILIKKQSKKKQWSRVTL